MVTTALPQPFTNRCLTAAFQQLRIGLPGLRCRVRGGERAVQLRADHGEAQVEYSMIWNASPLTGLFSRAQNRESRFCAAASSGPKAALPERCPIEGRDQWRFCAAPAPLTDAPALSISSKTIDVQ